MPFNTIESLVSAFADTAIQNSSKKMKKKLSFLKEILHICISFERNVTRLQKEIGGMAERFNAPVLKTDVAERLPGVRIPLPPLFY